VETTTIEVLKNGPYFITGPVTLLDADENPIPTTAGATRIKLCRCGRSAEKPFCDGSHRTSGWKETDVE